MAEIIPFMPRKDHEGAGDRSRTFGRALEVRAACEANAPFFEADRCRVAATLHRLLEEYHAAGIRKLDVVQEAGRHGDGVGSTKQLDTYTLPDETDEKRKGRLAKRAKGYLSFAEALARCAGAEADVMIARLFEGTDFGRGEAVEIDWAEQSYTRLCDLLRETGETVIAEAQLREFWRDVVLLPGAYNVCRDRIERRNIPLYQFYGGLLSAEFMFYGEMPPVPSTRLLRTLQGDPVPATINLEDGRSLRAHLMFWLDVHLSLGPLHTTADIGAVLECRSVLEADVAGAGIGRFDIPFNEGYEPVRELYLEKETLRLASEEQGQFSGAAIDFDDWASLPDAIGRNGIEHHYMMFWELTPGALREHFHYWDAQNRNNPGVKISTLNNECNGSSDIPSWFLPQTPAWEIHRRVLDGSLKRDLLARAELLVDQVDAYKQMLAERIRREESEARSRGFSAPVAKQQS